MTNRIMRLSGLIFALALLGAACGDDDSASSDDGATGTSTTEDTEETADDAEESAEDALGNQFGGDCAFLGEFAGTGFDPEFDPSSAMTDGGEALQSLAEQLDEVADAAPDEIDDAFETLADGYEQFAEAFSEIDLSDPANIDPSVFEDLEAPSQDFEAAAQEIDAWITENCDVAGS